MIHCNGNVELEANLNRKEVEWWQSRIMELGRKSEIISRDPKPVISVEECIEYLEIRGKGIFKEALLGCELAISVYRAYKMFHNCPGDYGGQAFLEIAINSYIYSKQFTLSMTNIDLEYPQCDNKDTIGH